MHFKNIKILIKQLHEKFPRSFCSSYSHMVYFTLDCMGEPHKMVDHEVGSISYVLEDNMDGLDEI